jgi:hypothetical protein
MQTASKALKLHGKAMEYEMFGTLGNGGAFDTAA